MRILLDTHSFLWFVAGDARIGSTARSLIADLNNTALLSIASLWEIAIKVSLGKLTLTEPFETLIAEQLALNAINVLPIEFDDLIEVTRLPFHHRDPFDRLLVAQAIARGLPIVSRDPVLDDYPIERLW
jgi:PIN domain nuclease of toxin-antitoxin system